jgi:hypothetical protein
VNGVRDKGGSGDGMLLFLFLLNEFLGSIKRASFTRLWLDVKGFCL